METILEAGSDSDFLFFAFLALAFLLFLLFLSDVSELSEDLSLETGEEAEEEDVPNNFGEEESSFPYALSNANFSAFSET